MPTDYVTDLVEIKILEVGPKRLMIVIQKFFSILPGLANDLFIWGQFHHLNGYKTLNQAINVLLILY